MEIYLHFTIRMTCCSWPRTSRGDGDAGDRTPSHGVVSAHCRLPVPCHVRVAAAARGDARREQTDVGRRRSGGERLHRCHSEHGATGEVSVARTVVLLVTQQSPPVFLMTYVNHTKVTSEYYHLVVIADWATEALSNRILKKMAY